MMEPLSSRKEGEGKASSGKMGRQTVDPKEVTEQPSPGTDGGQKMVPQHKWTEWSKGEVVTHSFRSRVISV